MRPLSTLLLAAAMVMISTSTGLAKAQYPTGPAPYESLTGEAGVVGGDPASFPVPSVDGFHILTVRTVCAADVWVRDTILGQVHGILYRNDGFDTIRYVRDHNGVMWVYGDPVPSRGGSNGWIPESALHGGGQC